LDVHIARMQMNTGFPSDAEGRGPVPLAAVLESELHGGRPLKPIWLATRADFHVDVWRNRYYRDDPEGYGYRSVRFRIGADDIAAAAGQFVEWSAPGFGYLEDFFWAADAISQADHDAADILQRYWGEENSPLPFGTVVRFERLAISRSSRSVQIWQLISHVVEREFMRRGSILLLKAFPLEYEGRLTKESPAALPKRFRQRCMAMRRHYRYRIGVAPVPGNYGRDGWMWRALRFCPTPRMKRK
jgi:hypothetical protein